ncbi:TPA: hypothetical protein ACHKRG_002601 [Enterococcus faecium]
MDKIRNYFDMYFVKVKSGWDYLFMKEDVKADLKKELEENGEDYEEYKETIGSYTLTHTLPVLVLLGILVLFVLGKLFSFLMAHKFIVFVILVVCVMLFFRFKKFMFNYYEEMAKKLFDILVYRDNQFDSYELEGSTYESIMFTGENGLFQHNKKLHIFKYRLLVNQAVMTQQEIDKLVVAIYADFNRLFGLTKEHINVDAVMNYGYLDVEIVVYKTVNEFDYVKRKGEVSVENLSDNDF